MNVSKIETKTQEIVLLLYTASSLTVLVSGAIYLNLNMAQLTTLTGNYGILLLDFLFSSLGYSVFFLALVIAQLGRYLLNNIREPQDIIKHYQSFTVRILAEAAKLTLIASFLGVFQGFYQVSLAGPLSQGLGGFVGSLIGGNLYYYFGVYGSLTILFVSLISALIIFGDLHLVSVYYTTKDIFKKSLEILQQLIVNLFEKVNDKYDGNLLKLIPGYHFERNVIVVEDDKVIDSGSVILEKSIAEPEVTSANLQTTEASSVVESSSGGVKKKTKAKRKKKFAIKPEGSLTECTEKEAPKSFADSIEINAYKKRYTPPSGELLESSKATKSISKEELDKKCQELEERLASFSIAGKVVDASLGSRLTMYEFMPAPGVRLSKLTGLTEDLALLLGADSIRILAPIPGKTSVGIEVPNKRPEMVNIGDMLKDLKKAAKTSKLPIIVGKDVFDNTIIEDIAKMPHMMVSGTTGSGKSVFINNLVVSLLYSQSPKKLRFLMIDPKMIELSPYNGIPHLLKPVVTDLDDAKDLLVWASNEMDRRYQAFADVGARDLSSFNNIVSESSKKLSEQKRGSKIDWNWEELPQIVIIVDELADLMITKGKEVEIPITRIAQKARAAGIHLILATQRPSAEVVTGLIKTNFPTRVAFKVSSSIDSRTILDSSGAEKLLGNGDMLYMTNGKSIERFQSAFISENEVRKLVNAIVE